MLTIKTNKNNCKLTYVPLNIDSFVTGDTVNDDITVITGGGHNLKENDTVSFIRQDGDAISYFENVEVKGVLDKDVFTIDGFGKYLVEVNGYKPSFIKYSSMVSELNYTTTLYTDHEIITITGDSLDSTNIPKTITAITISSIVKYISEDAFVGCVGLKIITVSEQNRNYSSAGGVLFNKNKTELICYPAQRTGMTYNIPTTVEKINNYAFDNVEILTNVTIPSFVKRIGRSAFGTCQNLINVVCKPTEAPIISNTSFNKPILEKIYVKSGYTGTYKSVWKKLKSKIFEDASIVDDIEINQKYTRLYLVSQPDAIEITGSTLDSGISENYADSLRAVEIGTNVETINYSTFRDCLLLTSVTIPNTVKTIGNYAFYGCRELNEILIPDSVVTIGDYAFSECVMLYSIAIGNGVKYIGKHGFYNIRGTMTSRANVYCDAKEPPVLGDSSVFATTFSGSMPKIYVPEESLNVYRGIYMQPNSLINLSSSTPKKYLCLNTNEHIFVTNKDNVNKRRRYLWNTKDSEYKYDGSLTMCNGDYYTFDDLFLIQNENNIAPICKNITLDITATTVGFEPILLTNCLIGVDFDGKDDKYHIYIPYDNWVNIEFINKLEDRLHNTTFTADDIRFLYDGNNQMVFGEELQHGAYLDKVCGNIEVDFNIGGNFETNLRHDEQVSNYVEKVKNESINKIIDYERYQYTPMYYDGSIPEIDNGNPVTVDEYLKSHSSEIDDHLKEVSEIKFQLYFRTKDFTLYDYEGQVIDKKNGDTKSTDYVDFGTWQTNDTGYWNSYQLRNDNMCLEPVYKNYGVRGDLLGYLGFTDDDVYYQKDALKKSFLRLSFYDSPNRETQKLLYYSTIYFDTNMLSRKYINDLAAWREDPKYTPQYNQLVFADDIVPVFKDKNDVSAITAELTCSDKYNNNNSSDGFYLHLFDKLVSGNTCTPIYMKAEFNNAKFGKTVPMIRPIFRKSNRPISPMNFSFPREYMKAKNNNGKVYNWTDMDMLVQDMYIKLFIKYDFNTNKYIWFVPQVGLKDEITFELFEPRVNGYDANAYNTMNGDGVGYGTEDGTPNWYTGSFNDDYVWVNENLQTEDEWARTFNGCCLMTTATTLQGANMLDGTMLFNKSAIKKIHSIWIDGMRVTGELVYKESAGEYLTNRLQLPDIPFPATTIHGSIFMWQPDTTTECWNDEIDEWEDNITNPKIIHRVNYYFNPTNADVSELFDELYLGIYNKKHRKRMSSTIETTQAIANQLKSSISNVTTGNKLPNGMFAGIRSLRCVKTVNNNGYSFVTIGNGAFNNCRSLVKVNADPGSIEIIGKNCFSGCRALKTAILSDVKVILREAFQGCYTLTKTIYAIGSAAKTKYIGCGAFGYTKIRSLILPNSVIRIANSAYRRCYQLEEFLFADNSNLQTIGKRAFGDCATLKYNLKHMGGNAKETYKYNGGTPEILLKLYRTGASVQYYDDRESNYVTLAISIDTDRGNVLYHYKNDEYKEYCMAASRYVYSFEDWMKYIF